MEVGKGRVTEKKKKQMMQEEMDALCAPFDAILLDFHDTLVTYRKRRYSRSDFADAELLCALARHAVSRNKLLALVSFGTLSELHAAMCVALGADQTVLTRDTIVAADHRPPAFVTLADDDKALLNGKNAMLLGLCHAYNIAPARALFIDDHPGIVAHARAVGFQHAFLCPKRAGLTRSWLEETLRRPP